MQIKHISQIRLICLISLIGISSAVFLPWIRGIVRAQVTNDSGLTISPPSLEISGNPGQTITNSIRLENRNDHAVKIAIDRRNFTAVGEEGAIGLTEEDTSFSLASWISVEGPNEIVLPGKSNHTFKFTINSPLTAEPGGHFGSIIFRTIPDNTLTGSGASLAQEIGSLILLRIAGDTREDGSIESFATSKNFYEYGPIAFETRMKNGGNVHLKPTGNITITNMFGGKVATVEVDSKNVLPGAVRKLDATWDTKWRVGRYTATAVLVYGKDQTQRAAVTNFVVFPYRVAIALGMIIMILALVIYKFRKRLSLAFKILTTGKA